MMVADCKLYRKGFRMNKCSFTTKRGKPCQNTAKKDGLCAVHYGLKAAQSGTRWDKAKQIATTVGSVAGGAAAIIKLVEEAVKLWSSLPFGPMPSEAHYENLLEKIGPFWPQMPKNYTPRSKSHPDWATAEEVYDEAQAILQGKGGSLEEEAAVEVVSEWFAGLPEWYQEEIANRMAGGMAE
jgi:hypothetical protein